MNSGKTHLAGKLGLCETEGVHAVVGEALEECGPRQAGEAGCGTRGETAEFVELHRGCEQEFRPGLTGCGVEGEQAFVRHFKENLAHARRLRGAGLLRNAAVAFLLMPGATESLGPCALR